MTFNVKGERKDKFDNNHGLTLFTPRDEKNREYTITVRTLFSGPFILPSEEAILVSSVYDVFISKKLKQPVKVEIGHCVHINELYADSDKLSFAIGKVDFAKKQISFELLEKGEMNEYTGKISITESSLLCVVYINSPPCQ